MGNRDTDPDLPHRPVPSSRGGRADQDAIFGIVGTPPDVSRAGHVLVEGLTVASMSDAAASGDRTAAFRVSPPSGYTTRSMMRNRTVLTWPRHWADTAAEDGSMPRGTRHEVTGLLLEQHGAYVLEIAGGGTWRLDVGRRARRLLGMRVSVVGIRDGFDLLAVEVIDRA